MFDYRVHVAIHFEEAPLTPADTLLHTRFGSQRTRLGYLSLSALNRRLPPSFRGLDDQE